MSTQTATDDAFMFDPDAETMSRDALTALQLERAKRTLEHAYANVPLYRQRLDATGVKPGDFKALADIARFPFTLKSDLRDNYPFGMFAVPREQVLRLHASSGTSGKPKGVPLTHNNLLGNARSLIERAQRTSQDIFLGVLPMFHAFALTGTMITPARGLATSCTMLMAMACSPAASARTTAPSGLAARSFRCRAAAPSAR